MIERPATRVAHGLEVARRETLEAAERHRPPFRIGKLLDHEVVGVVFAVHRDGGRQPDRSDARQTSEPFGDALVRARCLVRIAYQAFGYRDDERLHVGGADESWIDLSHRHECPHHQPRDNQQRQRQRHLPHDERIPRAMPRGRVARRSAAFLERRDARPPELHHCDCTEQGACEDRQRHGEEQDRAVDVDLVHARQFRRRDRPQQCGGGQRQRHSDNATRLRQDEALGEQRAREAAARRAKGGPHREFMVPPFRVHQEQVGDVPAGDEQYDADGGEENPENAPDVADHLGGQRTHVRT